MSALRQRMLEDRYLRDTARALVEADLRHLRTDMSQKSMGERAADRIRQGAADVYDEAIEVASDNKGALAALVAAIVLWFARNPILALFFEDEADGEPDKGDLATER